MNVEDIGATRMLWQCSRCGKWSVAKRRPVEHQRYVLRENIGPGDTLVDTLESFYTHTRPKVLVWCGPFIAFQAAPVQVHNDQHYQTQWDGNQQRRRDSQRINTPSVAEPPAEVRLALPPSARAMTRAHFDPVAMRLVPSQTPQDSTSQAEEIPF